MLENYLKIKISRFTAGDLLLQDIFVYLPLNNKILRIRAADTELDQVTLENLVKKGITFLYVKAPLGQTVDEDTIKLQYVLTQPDTLSNPGQPLNTPSSANANSLTDTIDIEKISTGEEKTSIEVESPIKEKPSVATLDEGTTDTVLIKTDALTHAENRISTESEGKISTPTVKNAMPEKDFQKHLKAGEDLSEDFTKIASVTEHIKNESMDISGQDFDLETEKKKIIKRKLDEELVELEAKIKKLPEEVRAEFHIKADSIKEDIRKVSGDNSMPEEIIQRFSQDEEIQDLERIFTRNNETEDTIEYIIGNKKHAKNESAPRNTEEKSASEVGTDNQNILDKATEKLLSSPNKKDENIFLEEESQVLTFRGSRPPQEKLTKISGETEKEGFDKQSFSNIQAKGLPLQNGNKLIDQSVLAADLNDDDELIAALEESLESDVRSVSVAPNEPKHAPAQALRDGTDHLPSVGKLAAQLAHTLGYVSETFLRDLALSAILHFSIHKGSKLSTTKIPALSKLILEEETSNSVLQDSKEILFLLESYMRDPGSASNRTDFVKQAFERTTTNLLSGDNSMNAWNIMKWKQAFEKGVSMNTHSLCTKASSEAYKISRDLIE